jgi:hypothetical protein
MKPEYDSALYQEFALLHASRPGSWRETPMGFGIECGEGWFALLRDLSTKLEALILRREAKGWLETLCDRHNEQKKRGGKARSETREKRGGKARREGVSTHIAPFAGSRREQTCYAVRWPKDPANEGGIAAEWPGTPTSDP